MATVRQLLDAKGHDVWSITPRSSVFEALELMSEKDVGALLVVDKEGRLEGIFSERDYARKLVLKGKISKKTSVADLMTENVIHVSPSASFEECMQVMTEKRIRHLPVLEEGRVAGIVTIGDVVKQIISRQEMTIKHLGDYISGGY